jgi:hypothetical protein
MARPEKKPNEVIKSRYLFVDDKVNIIEESKTSRNLAIFCLTIIDLVERMDGK